jgi:plasmid stability protein
MLEGEMEGKTQWVVRGVDKDLARRFVDRAASQRRPTGDVLNEVLRAYLAGPEDPALPAAGASSGSEGAGDFAKLVKLVEKHQRILPDILARLDRLEAGGTAPAGTPLDAVEPEKSAAIPVPTEAAPEPSDAAGELLVTGGQGTRRRLTAAGIAEVERMIRAGVGDAEIAGRIGMDRGAIRQRRLKLERSSSPQSVEQSIEAIAGQQDGEGQQQLSTGEMTAIPDEHSEQAYLCQIAGMTVAEAIELKGWTWEEHELAAAVERWREKHHVQEMLLLEHHHQIATMLEAGKSGVEIKAWLAQQRAELPASHVDENPVPPPAATD